LSPSKRIPVGVSSIGKERNNVLPSGEKTSTRFTPLSVIGKNGGLPAEAKEMQQQAKQATSEFLNMYFRVFMVYYIFFALLYPNSREIVWATFLIQSAETRTTSFDSRSLGPEIQIAPQG
jgi:hypothetical protein